MSDIFFLLFAQLTSLTEMVLLRLIISKDCLKLSVDMQINIRYETVKNF